MLPLTPTRLGRYEIVDEIGKGAMGVVYLARDPLIGRLVALKTFRVGFSLKDDELGQFRARFIREAQSAGILSHPNIVTIHDVVERSDEGMAFIAMEYVRGTNLKAVLQEDRRPPLAYVSGIVGQIAAGLDYAHSCRVIHRDIKPANILITADNRVKITDFGIARLDTSNITQEGQLLGTPNYMAPEQILGREVDHRADVFALGVVLYEMVTRHKPFQGENLTMVSHRIVYDHFTPLQAYINDLPAGIDKIVARALEKDPGRRYQTARELGDDLRRVVNVTIPQDMLSETQSLSTTMVVPADLVAPPSWAGTQRSDQIGAGTQRSDQDRLAASAGSQPADQNRAGGRRSDDPAAGTASGGARSSSAPWATSVSPAKGGRRAERRGFLPSRWWRGLVARAASASSTPAAAPPPAAAQPPAAVQAAQPSFGPSASTPARRLALLAGAAAAVALLLGWGLVILAGRTGPAAPRSAGNDLKRFQLMALIRHANERMEAGDPQGAVAAYRAAQEVAPGRPGLSRRLKEAQQQQEELGRRLDQEHQIDGKIKEARQALAERRFDEALVAAESVLLDSPGNTVAEEIKTSVRRARQKEHAATATARQISRPAEQGGAARPDQARGTDPKVAPAPGSARVPEARDSTLEVGFFSELSAGTLIIYANDVQLMRQSFHFQKRGVFFLSKAGKGELHDSFRIPAGSITLKVYVTPNGRAAQYKILSGEFPVGGSRRLDIRLSETGEVTAQLQ